MKSEDEIVEEAWCIMWKNYVPPHRKFSGIYPLKVCMNKLTVVKECGIGGVWEKSEAPPLILSLISFLLQKGQPSWLLYGPRLWAGASI